MTGIIIGRFQVPRLHPGHLHLIATALAECDEVMIILGVSNQIDARNPYSIMNRVAMIKKIFPHISIGSIQDRPSNQTWSERIDDMTSTLVDPILYHSRDSFRGSYTGKLSLREVEEVAGYSGTKMRTNEL